MPSFDVNSVNNYIDRNCTQDGLVASWNRLKKILVEAEKQSAAPNNKQRDAILLLDRMCLRMELLFEHNHWDVETVSEYKDAKQFVVQNSIHL